MPVSATNNPVPPPRRRPSFLKGEFRVLQPLPPGELFYPCSGDDLFRPLRLFRTEGRTLHGADLDSSDFTVVGRRYGLQVDLLDSTTHSFEIEGKGVVPHAIHNMRNGDGWRRKPVGVRERFRVRTLEGPAGEWTVVRHRYDAIEALKQIPTLALFYAAGDRYTDGEGASGISWLGNALLPLVLSKLAPGGLLVTTGLGLIRREPPYIPGQEQEELDEDSEIADQRALWVQTAEDWPITEDFSAFGRRFRLLTGISVPRRYEDLWIWRCD